MCECVGVCVSVWLQAFVLGRHVGLHVLIPVDTPSSVCNECVAISGILIQQYLLIYTISSNTWIELIQIRYIFLMAYMILHTI